MKTGELVAIIGPVGSGKSSILQVRLQLPPQSYLSRLAGNAGGATHLQGQGVSPGQPVLCSTRGSTPVYSQENLRFFQAWVFGGSVRNNILFGEAFDEEHYWKVRHIRNCFFSSPSSRLRLNLEDTFLVCPPVFLSFCPSVFLVVPPSPGQTKKSRNL